MFSIKESFARHPVCAAVLAWPGPASRRSPAAHRSSPRRPLQRTNEKDQEKPKTRSRRKKRERCGWRLRLLVLQAFHVVDQVDGSTLKVELHASRLRGEPVAKPHYQASQHG